MGKMKEQAQASPPQPPAPQTPAETDVALASRETPAWLRAVERPSARAQLEALAGGRSVDDVIARLRAVALEQPQIVRAAPEDVLMAVARAVALDLHIGTDPRTAHLLLIPREGRDGRVQIAAQMTATGAVALLARAGYEVSAQAVYAEDEFDIDLGELRVRHRRALADRGQLLGAYAVFRRADTGRIVHIEVAGREDIKKMAEASDAYRAGERARARGQQAADPWHRWPERMAVRSVIVRGARHLALPEREAAGIAMAAELEGRA